MYNIVYNIVYNMTIFIKGLHSGYDPYDHDNLINQSLNPGFDPGQGHDD